MTDETRSADDLRRAHQEAVQWLVGVTNEITAAPPGLHRRLLVKQQRDLQREVSELLQAYQAADAREAAHGCH